MYIRTNPYLRTILYPFVRFCEWFGARYPRMFVKIRYFVRFHKPLHLKNPQTLNEKILYLTLCTDTSAWTKLADKYAVREYMSDMGLEDILVKLYGVWDRAEDCDFSLLPDKFVLKCNHGSGDVVIINDKTKVDEKKILKSFESQLSKPYGALEGGLHYMRIKPCLIAEELLDVKLQSIETQSLIDYKIWCFNGKPKYIWTVIGRSESGLLTALYDTEWNDCSSLLTYNNHYKKAIVVVPKPQCLDKMLFVAERISSGFPVLRCDLYVVDNKVYFGEMTFSSNGGMMVNYSDVFQQMCGNEIVLPSY